MGHIPKEDDVKDDAKLFPAIQASVPPAAGRQGFVREAPGEGVEELVNGDAHLLEVV